MFPQKMAKKLAFLTHNKAKKLIITLVFEKNGKFLAKIAKNCDHNTDPVSFKSIHCWQLRKFE
jgi:hypothetical protein